MHIDTTYRILPYISTFLPILSSSGGNAGCAGLCGPWRQCKIYECIGKGIKIMILHQKSERDADWRMKKRTVNPLKQTNSATRFGDIEEGDAVLDFNDLIIPQW